MLKIYIYIAEDTIGQSNALQTSHNTDYSRDYVGKNSIRNLHDLP